MSSRSYRVVEMFEEAVAERIGAKYGVAVESCTFAIFLSCLWCKVAGHDVWVPPRTYISVPQAVMHAGGKVRWSWKEDWVGKYFLEPYDIADSAKCFDKGSYDGGLHCVSFHIRKACPIGRGGMVLTDDAEKADWLRKMRYEGRAGLPYAQERVELCGWNAYMTPEQAARGLMILETLPDTIPPDGEVYPDLREMPLFKDKTEPQAYCEHDFSIMVNAKGEARREGSFACGCGGCKELWGIVGFRCAKCGVERGCKKIWIGSMLACHEPSDTPPSVHTEAEPPTGTEEAATDSHFWVVSAEDAARGRTCRCHAQFCARCGAEPESNKSRWPCPGASIK